jgi:serine protease inhibitor
MATKSMPVADPIELVLDRPFMFAIMHEPTGTILFLGRVVQP